MTEIRAIAKKQKKTVGANPGSTRNTMWYRDTSRLRPEFRFDRHSKKYSLSGTVNAAKSISISGGPISFQAVKNFLARNGITAKKAVLSSGKASMKTERESLKVQECICSTIRRKQRSCMLDRLGIFAKG